MGFHPRLLSYLKGKDQDEEWESLRRIVMEPDTDPSDVLKGNWAPYWGD